MGLFSNFFDRFKAADFQISPNMKIKSIQSEFKNNFGLTLRVYKGKVLADPEITFAQLNKLTSKDIKTNSSNLVIKANMTISEFEKLVSDHFGITVQVANEWDTYNVNNKYTLGQASRREDEGKTLKIGLKKEDLVHSMPGLNQRIVKRSKNGMKRMVDIRLFLS